MGREVHQYSRPQLALIALIISRSLLTGYTNAQVLHLNTKLQTSWQSIASLAHQGGCVDVVLIDAAHDYNSVLFDIQLSLAAGIGPVSQDKRPRFIALDD